VPIAEPAGDRLGWIGSEQTPARADDKDQKLHAPCLQQLAWSPEAGTANPFHTLGGTPIAAECLLSKNNCGLQADGPLSRSAGAAPAPPWPVASQFSSEP